jgi:intracellular septation protein
VRTLLSDMAAGLLFLAVLLVSNDIYLATGAGIILGLGQAAWSWVRRRKIEVVQWLGAGLVVVMGGATILFHDPRFVMFKPTIFYVCAGLLMLKSGWMYRYLPARNTAKPLPAAAAQALRRVVEVAGAVYAAATLCMAALNALFAMYASQKGWALFNALGAALVYTVLGSVLFVGSKLVWRKFGINPGQYRPAGS